MANAHKPQREMHEGRGGIGKRVGERMTEKMLKGKDTERARKRRREKDALGHFICGRDRHHSANISVGGSYKHDTFKSTKGRHI